jgi:hypothetical protein
VVATLGKFPQRDFKLTECKSYSNGSVGLRYERMPHIPAQPGNLPDQQPRKPPLRGIPLHAFK